MLVIYKPFLNNELGLFFWATKLATFGQKREFLDVVCSYEK